MSETFKALWTTIVLGFLIWFLVWGATEGYKYVGR